MRLAAPLLLLLGAAPAAAQQRLPTRETRVHLAKADEPAPPPRSFFRLAPHAGAWLVDGQSLTGAELALELRATRHTMALTLGGYQSGLRYDDAPDEVRNLRYALFSYGWIGAPFEHLQWLDLTARGLFGVAATNTGGERQALGADAGVRLHVPGFEQLAIELGGRGLVSGGSVGVEGFAGLSFGGWWSMVPLIGAATSRAADWPDIYDVTD